MDTASRNLAVVPPPMEASDAAPPVPQPDGIVEEAGQNEEVPVFPFVHADGRWKGRPDGHYVENVMALLDSMGVEVRYNEMARRIDFLGPEFVEENDAWNSILNTAYRFGLSKEATKDFIIEIAYRNSYHPFKDWVLRLPWDGTDRIPAFFDTVTHDPTFPVELKVRLLFTWAISAIRAVFHPEGINTQGCLVFQGEQGRQKTRWFLSIFPPGMAQDGVCLDPGNKDSIDRATTRVATELGELESTYNRRLPLIKAFITSPTDLYRKPYARVTEDFKRRTVFFATVNDSDFLTDRTGNRRWWTIPVVACAADHGIDIQQLWAQFLNIYDSGHEQHWLDNETVEALNRTNLDFTPEDPMESLVLDRVVFLKDGEGHPTGGPNGDGYMRASDVWRALHSLPADYKLQKADSGAVAKLGRILKRLGARAGALTKSGGNSARHLVDIR